MSLRARFVLALVGLVAVATALIGAFSYRTTRAELLGQRLQRRPRVVDDLARFLQENLAHVVIVVASRPPSVGK